METRSITVPNKLLWRGHPEFNSGPVGIASAGYANRFRNKFGMTAY